MYLYTELLSNWTILDHYTVPQQPDYLSYLCVCVCVIVLKCAYECLYLSSLYNGDLDEYTVL